jgi:hypothetical protein
MVLNCGRIRITLQLQCDFQSHERLHVLTTNDLGQIFIQIFS